MRPSKLIMRSDTESKMNKKKEKKKRNNPKIKMNRNETEKEKSIETNRNAMIYTYFIRFFSFHLFKWQTKQEQVECVTPIPLWRMFTQSSFWLFYLVQLT